MNATFQYELIPIKSASDPGGTFKGYAGADAAIDGDDTQTENQCFCSALGMTTESRFIANIPKSRVDSIGFKGQC